MGAYGLIIAVLIVVGVIIVFTLRADFVTKRAYGLLALALLAVVALGYLWPAVFAASAHNSSGTDDLGVVIIVGFFTFATILATALLGVVGLIEMAVARQWWWLATLLAAMALMAVMVFLPFLTNTPSPSSPPDSFLQRDTLWLAGEAVVFLVCAGYGVRATWFRSSPAAPVAPSE